MGRLAQWLARLNFGFVAQWLECAVHIGEVRGSNPLEPTEKVGGQVAKVAGSSPASSTPKF